MRTPPPSARSPELLPIVQSIILAMSVGLLVWVAALVVKHGEILAAHSVMLPQLDGRVVTLETRGSSALTSHVASDEAIATSTKGRLDKVESSALLVAALQGDVKIIIVRLDDLRLAVQRLEKSSP